MGRKYHFLFLTFAIACDSSALSTDTIDSGVAIIADTSEPSAPHDAGIADAGTQVVLVDAPPRERRMRLSTTALHHTCAINLDGRVKCWGDNGRGQIGDSTTSLSRPNPVEVTGIISAEALSSGGAHNCVVLTSGEVACWGLVNGGRLGNGATSYRLQPGPVHNIP